MDPASQQQSQTQQTATRTLFIVEMPQDITEEDLQNVFCKEDGFLASRIRQDRKQRLVGFVDFDTTENAIKAREKYQGHICYDGAKPLNIQYAVNATRRLRATNSRRGGVGGNKGNINSNNTPLVVFPSSGRRFYGYRENLPHNFEMHPAQWNHYGQNMPPDASSTLFVEGLPPDATEREVSHIFRPFPGFQSLRIITKNSKLHPDKFYHLCFVEFDNKSQATTAMNVLQGYRMDIHDPRGLKMSYAKSTRRFNTMSFASSSPSLSPSSSSALSSPHSALVSNFSLAGRPDVVASSPASSSVASTAPATTASSTKRVTPPSTTATPATISTSTTASATATATTHSSVAAAPTSFTTTTPNTLPNATPGTGNTQSTNLNTTNSNNVTNNAANNTNNNMNNRHRS
jgi:RNA recognition motif-containing protein